MKRSHSSAFAYCLLYFTLANLHSSKISASVVRECIDKFSSSASCSKDAMLAVDCILKSVNKSWDYLDVTARITTQFEILKSNYPTFCKEWSKMGKGVESCEKDPTSCSVNVPQTSYDVCGRNPARCHYLKYAKCGIKAGMLQAKNVHQLQSEVCLETDLNRGFIPYYGPHLECYQNKINYPEYVAFPLDHYLKFCEWFKYETLKNCVEKKISETNTDELLVNKTLFLSEARGLLQQSNNFCEGISKIDESVLTKCRMMDVLVCTKETFERALNGTHGEYYGQCISKQYTKCHPSIGALIMEILGVKSSGNSVNSFFLIFLVSFLLQRFWQE